jgi:glycosyltransferase involved in cell wall biosynthesis
MKIAFVYDVIYPFVTGGVEKRIHELAIRLAGSGNDVHVIGMKSWEGPATIVRDGVTLHGICPAQPLYAGGRRTITEALSFSIRLAPFLLRERFDLIDCQQFPYFPCFPAKAASVIRRTPVVITWHEVWGDYWYEYLGRKGFFGRLTERLVAGLTRNIIAVSTTTAQKLRTLGIHRDVPIIPNGIDLRHLDSVPAGTVRSDIIYAGRLIRHKHVDMLVKAFALLLHESPGLTLLIIGDGPERETIAALARDPVIAGRIMLKPFSDSHDDVIGSLKASRVCVIPSTREGFGITALEALACGLPVVTIDHPDNAIRDLISPDTGFLAGNSAEDLAEKVRIALRRHPEMRAACMHAAERYDWDLSALRMSEFYRALIAS